MRITIIILSLFLSGCVSVGVEPTPQKQVSGKEKKALTQMNQVFVGMTYQEVSNLMGERVFIGYEGIAGDPQPIALQSPYRVETLKDGEKSYEVLYYFTHIQKADGMIADDELTPLIFEEERLIGKGWDFLFKLKNTVK